MYFNVILNKRRYVYCSTTHVAMTECLQLQVIVVCFPLRLSNHTARYKSHASTIDLTSMMIGGYFRTLDNQPITQSWFYESLCSSGKSNNHIESAVLQHVTRPKGSFMHNVQELILMVTFVGKCFLTFLERESYYFFPR